MGSNDTAALVVALSAQLTKFEKDMKSAVDVADKNVKKIEDRFGAANKVISDRLSGFAANASAQLGLVGQVMNTLGPVGLGLAAAVGSLALAFSFVSDKVDGFAEKAKKLKEAAETAGLTMTQFRLLSAAGAKVGLDSEQTEVFINRLTVSFDELRRGSGNLFDQLLRIDVGLVRDLAAARNTAEAIDILSRAYANLTDQAQRNTLARAIGGRSGMAGGRLLDMVADGGGLRGLQDSAEAAGKKIDEVLLERVARLRREIDEINKRTNNIWGNAFSVEVLEQQKRSAEFWERIAVAIVRASQFATPTSEGALPQGTKFARRFRGQDRPFSAGSESSELTAEQLLQAGRSSSGFPAQERVPLPTPRPQMGAQQPSASVELELLRRYTALLGDAITPAEQLKLKILELDAAQEKGGVTDESRVRALAAFKHAQEQVAVSTRERLGIASEEEMVSARLRDLDALRAKGYVKSAEEMAQAERIIAREAKLSAEALQVRASSLPGLTQFGLDAQNLSKQLDSLSTTSLSNLGTALTDVAMGTVSAADGFKNFGLQVVRSLSDMILKMLILAPLAKSLEGILTGGGGLGLTFSGIGIPGNAAGTDNWSGGPTWVGERGPEVVTLPRGAQVIPNDVLRQGGGGSFNVVVNNNARGVVPEVRQTRDSGGQPTLEVVISEVGRRMAGGAFDAPMKARFGAQVRPRG